MGTDFWLYDGLAKNMHGLTLPQVLSSSPQEWGFTTLTFAIQKLLPFPNAVFVVCSTATVVFVYEVLRRELAQVAEGVTVYVLFAFYVSPFNIVRQGLAVSIVFYARSVWGERRWLAILLYLVAVSIHISAVAAIAMQLLERFFGRSRLFVPVLMILALVGAAALIAAPQARVVVAYLNPRYADYLDTAGAGFGTIATAAIFGILAFASAIVGKQTYDDRARQWQNYLFIGVGFLIAGVAAAPVARMAQYFLIYLVLLAPRRLDAVARPGMARVICTCTGVVFLAFWLRNYDGLLPYNWIFS